MIGFQFIKNKFKCKRTLALYVQRQKTYLSLLKDELVTTDFQLCLNLPYSHSGSVSTVFGPDVLVILVVYAIVLLRSVSYCLNLCSSLRPHIYWCLRASRAIKNGSILKLVIRWEWGDIKRWHIAVQHPASLLGLTSPFLCHSAYSLNISSSRQFVWSVQINMEIGRLWVNRDTREAVRP